MDNGGLARLPAGLTRTVLRTVHTLGARANRNMVSAIVSHAGKVSAAECSAPGFTATGVHALPVHTGLVPVSFVVLECEGATEITVLCAVAAPEGVAALEKTAPDARLFTVAVDDGLNEIAFIVPGLGDAGDRQYGPR